MVSLNPYLKCYSDVFVVFLILLLSVWNMHEMPVDGLQLMPDRHK